MKDNMEDQYPVPNVRFFSFKRKEAEDSDQIYAHRLSLDFDGRQVYVENYSDRKEIRPDDMERLFMAMCGYFSRNNLSHVKENWSQAIGNVFKRNFG